MEPALGDRCDLVREVQHRQFRGPRQWFRRARVATALLCGRPRWVSWWAVDAYARVVRDTARAWRPDVVQLEFHLMGQYLPALAECPAPRILVQHEPGASSADTWRTGGPAVLALPARMLAGVLTRLERHAWRRYEAAIFRQVDAVVVFTERDRASVLALAPERRVARIPLGTILPTRASDPVGTDAASLLFIGSFAHSPNADAARRLAVSILPRVQARRSDARVILVGSHPPDDLRRRAGDFVELAESVPDVGPYLDRANLVVIPLRRGGGMRVKVLEALAAGKAVIASRLAVEGLDLHDGRQFSLAETDAEFAAAILSLLEDPDRRRQLGTEARSWASRHLGWSRAVDSYETLYRSLVTG
jgi:glycosyltransferase involved in cell wall biosynthesis